MWTTWSRFDRSRSPGSRHPGTTESERTVTSKSDGLSRRYGGLNRWANAPGTGERLGAAPARGEGGGRGGSAPGG